MENCVPKTTHNSWQNEIVDFYGFCRDFNIIFVVRLYNVEMNNLNKYDDGFGFLFFKFFLWHFESQIVSL